MVFLEGILGARVDNNPCWCYFDAPLTGEHGCLMTDPSLVEEYFDAFGFNAQENKNPAVAALIQVGQPGATPMVLVQQQTNFDGINKINQFLTQQKEAGIIKGDFYADGMFMIMSQDDYTAVQETVKAAKAAKAAQREGQSRSTSMFR